METKKNPKADVKRNSTDLFCGWFSINAINY